MEHEPLNSDAQARMVEHIIDAIDSRLTNYPNAKAIDKAHQNRMIKSALNKHPSRYTYPGCKQKNGVPYGTDSVRLLLKQIVRDHQLSSNYDISDEGLNALFENGSDFITDAFWKVLCQAHLIKGVQPTSDWQGVSNIDKDADNLLDASSEKRLDGSKSNDHIDDEEALYHQPPAVMKDSGKTKSDGHNGAERPPVTTQRTLRQPASAAGTRKTIDSTGVRKTSKAESVGTRSNIRSNSMAATPVFNHLYDKPLDSGQVSSTSNAGRKRGSLRISDDDDTIYVNHPEHANPQQGPIKKAKVPSSTKTQNASGEESNALIALDQGAAQTIAMTGETLHNGPVIIRSGTKRVNSAPGINEPPTKKAKINPLPPPLVASSQSSSAFSKKSGKQLAPAKLAPSRTRQPASERSLLGQGEAQMDGDLDLSTGRETHQDDLVDDFMSDAGSQGPTLPNEPSGSRSAGRALSKDTRSMQPPPGKISNKKDRKAVSTLVMDSENSLANTENNEDHLESLAEGESGDYQQKLNHISGMIGQTSTAVFKPNDNVRPAGVNFRPDRSLEQLYIATFRPKPREPWKNAVAPLQEEESFTPQALLEALIWTYIRTAILSKDDVPWTAPHHMITIESTELIREELRKHPKVKFDAVARKASEAQLEYVYFLTNDLISAARDLSIDLHLILVGHLSNHEGESSHLQTGWSKALKSNIQETCSEALLLLGLLTARAIKHQWSTVAEEVLSRGTIGSNRNFVVATSPVLFELEENESKVLRACLPAARAELNEGLQTSARRVGKNRAMRRRADEDADEEMEDPGAVDEEQDSESEQPGRKAELTVDQEFMTSNMDSEAEDEFESDNEEVDDEEVDDEESYEPLHEESPD